MGRSMSRFCRPTLQNSMQIPLKPIKMLLNGWIRLIICMGKVFYECTVTTGIWHCLGISTPFQIHSVALCQPNIFVFFSLATVGVCWDWEHCVWCDTSEYFHDWQTEKMFRARVEEWKPKQSAPPLQQNLIAFGQRFAPLFDHDRRQHGMWLAQTKHWHHRMMLRNRMFLLLLFVVRLQLLLGIYSKAFFILFSTIPCICFYLSFLIRYHLPDAHILHASQMALNNV